MVAKKRIKRINLPSVDLNITSLLDVLTVLLFFLVKSFSVSQTSVTPPDRVRIPASAAQEKIEEGVTVAFSPDGLLYNGKMIVVLRDGRFDKKDLGTDGKTVAALKSLLDEEQKKRAAVYGAKAEDFIPPGRIVIQADRELPFGVMKHLLHTASGANYSNFQFVVATPE